MASNTRTPATPEADPPGTGPAAAARSATEILATRARSVPELFRSRVTQSPSREAFRYPRGDGWVSVTWGELDARMRRVAAGLIALGVEPEERVAIAATTRFEWVLADLAIMCAGAAVTTVYPSTRAEHVAFILADSASRVVFAEDAEQLAKLSEYREKLPDVVRVVVIDPAGTPAAAGATHDDWVISLAALEQLGVDYLRQHPDTVDTAISRVGPDSLATLIYTSGTTGLPKGVRLAHDCWTYEAAAIEALHLLGPDDLQYLWLPLAHVFGKVLLAAQLQAGFPTAVDGRVDKIVENVAVVRPTFMGAAPRIFEKAYGRIVTTIAAEGGVKKKLFDWAVGVGREMSATTRAGRAPSRALALRHRLADRLVFAKIRARFGGRIRFFVSGSAPLDTAIAEWFHAAGVLVLEGYGLTESSAGSTVNVPEAFRFGTVGRAFPGTEVRIATDGEVLLRGPGVMRGYHGLVDEQERMLDADGWLHTGDIGVLEDGFLRITDRKSDLVKTSNGKYVSPQLIEIRFKGICPYVSNVLVHGARRSFCTALITLAPDTIGEWAATVGLGDRPYAEIAASPQARTMVQGYVDQLNAGLERWETVKRFTILPRDLSIEDDELTPSLKVRRSVVEGRFRAELDAMYASAGGPAPGSGGRS